MILIEFLRENEIKLTEKGIAIIAKVLRDMYPTLDTELPDSKIVYRALVWDMPEEQCLKILQYSAKYASLWAFA